MAGWILVSAPDESSPSTHCWNGEDWIDISDANNAKLFLIGDGSKIENMRYCKADWQQRYTDRDVRISEISITVTLNQVPN